MAYSLGLSAAACALTLQIAQLATAFVSMMLVPQSCLVLQAIGANTVTGASADTASDPADAKYAPILQAMQNEAFSFDLSAGASTGSAAGDQYSLAGVHQAPAGSQGFLNYQAQVRLSCHLTFSMV